jgi:hypothetical protein
MDMNAAGTPTILALHLEGPFAVVTKSKDNNRIFAFTIYDADHQFLVNGQQISFGANDSFHFNLQGKGLNSYQTTQVDAAFYWTNKSAPKWKYDDKSYFVSLSLPCPMQIRQDSISVAVFKDGTKGAMPRNHIFVYEIKSFDDVRLNCNELGTYSPGANGILRLELGRPVNNNGDPKHPIMFYNNLLTYLGLDGDASAVLTAIQDQYPMPAADADRVAAKPPAEYHPFTATLECKAGGIIGQT